MHGSALGGVGRHVHNLYPMMFTHHMFILVPAHFSLSKHILAMSRRLESDRDRDVLQLTHHDTAAHAQSEAEIDAELDDILGVTQTKQVEKEQQNSKK